MTGFAFIMGHFMLKGCPRCKGQKIYLGGHGDTFVFTCESCLKTIKIDEPDEDENEGYARYFRKEMEKIKSPTSQANKVVSPKDIDDDDDFDHFIDKD